MMNASKQSAAAVLVELQSSSDGLPAAGVERARNEAGWNELPKKKASVLRLLLAQFNDVLVYILLGALALSVATPFFEGHHVDWSSFVDAYVIVAILLLNAVLGFVQEFKAESAIASLEELSSPTANVRRSGEIITIPSRELVPGDIVLLEEGDRVSADGRLIKVSHLRVNESSLTGESLLQDKHTNALEHHAPIADQENMVFSGTLVAAGSAEYVVTATGTKTQIGTIADLVANTEIPQTPLQQKMQALGRNLGFIVVGLCLLVWLISYWYNHTLIQSMLIAVSLAVSAVPEGLPAVVTVCFALGVKRMVKKNALVRRLDSLETLGSVTIICSDKTGTITQNRMTVTDTWLYGSAALSDLLQIAASCNRARLPDFGDPTEIGLLQAAKDKQVERLPIDDEEQPFSSEKKYMQTRHADVSFIKGAPEVVVGLCSNVDADTVLEQNRQYAKQGSRVLACARKTGQTTEFVGLIAMEDPPRPSVADAVKRAHAAGIKTTMITGDNLETAQAIARSVGIDDSGVHGDELENLTPVELQHLVKKTHVFARVSPQHKLLILEALKANGEIVAMSGDGVNDAPALKGAHVGVSMGMVGTDVARQASAMVLADDNFSTIVAAIEEGRRIYDNIRKFVLYLLRANFYQILLIIGTILSRLPLPYLPTHILWINLMTDSLPALALGLEPAEPDSMKRPPRPANEGILSGEWVRLVLAALIGFALIYGLYVVYEDLYPATDTYNLQYVRAVLLTAAIVMELCMAFSVRSRHSIFKISFTSNPWLLGAVAVPVLFQIILLYTPLVRVFSLQPITLTDWLVSLGIGLTALITFEAFKLVTARFQKPQAA